MLRAVRIFNALAAGTLTGAQLDAQLTGSRLADWALFLQSRSAMQALARNATARAALFASTIGLIEAIRSPFFTATLGSDLSQAEASALTTSDSLFPQVASAVSADAFTRMANRLTPATFVANIFASTGRRQAIYDNDSILQWLLDARGGSRLYGQDITAAIQAAPGYVNSTSNAANTATIALSGQRIILNLAVDQASGQPANGLNVNRGADQRPTRMATQVPLGSVGAFSRAMAFPHTGNFVYQQSGNANNVSVVSVPV